MQDSAGQSGCSLDALVREAVADYLAKCQSDVTEAFGAWREAKLEDGLAYEARLRAEWE